MDNTHQKKMTLGILILGVIILALYLFPSKLITKSKSSPDSSSLLASQILSINNTENPNEDPDGDGIPNWQEKILGTDPHVKNERSKENFQISSEDQKRISDPNNLTVALAKNNLSVASYAQSLGSTTDINYEGLSDDVLRTTAAAFSFKTYTEADLINKVAPTQASRRVFGNAIALSTSNLLKKYLNTDEILGLNDLTDHLQGTDNIKNLQAKTLAVRAFVNELLAMPVPSDAVSYQLGYINAIERYAETLEGFLTVNDDPLKAGLLLRGYKDIVQSQYKFLADFESYFKKNNLIFSKKESGYIFTHGFSK